MRIERGGATTQKLITNYYNGNANFLSAITGFPGQTGGFNFQASGDDSTIVSRLFIDTYGNVGIGTVNPTEKLEVAGKIKQTGYNTYNVKALHTIYGVSTSAPTKVGTVTVPQ